MKRLSIVFISLFMSCALFAQADLQVLATVKLSKNESITVKQLKSRVEAYQKQRNQTLNLQDRKKVLDALIQEKLILQAASKDGLTIPESAVDQYFLQSVSQSIGREVDLKEFEQIVQEQTNMSLDAYMQQMSGMNVAEYKQYLKTQLIAQQYILKERQNELKEVAPSDEEIRNFYELNKASFVWSDMLKRFLVIVPKGTDSEKARIKANEYYNKLKDKKLTSNQITVESRKENSGFQAGEILVNKNQVSAQQLGISYQELIALFDKDRGFVSTCIERDTNFQFYTIVKKFDAKMLSLSDVVQPETTTTVYDYIKQNLGQQKQMEYLANAANEIATSLDKPENVDRRKSGAELDKYLTW